MKKNMVVIALMMSFFSSQFLKAGCTQRLSFNACRFVQDSQKQGFGSYFAQGTLRDDWLLKAIDVILGGSNVRAANKDYLIERLHIMADILVGEPLRKNTKISDDQYNSIMDNVKRKIEVIVQLKAVGH